MPLSAGTRLGPYEILASLGAGGMGEVYRARDTRLGRDVAIKVAHEQFSERFEREARAIAALNHPNICQLYDVGPNYLVMELVEGDALQGPLPLAEALRIASQIIEALEAAHEKGIIHRDLKPANIKITPQGVVKVLDFGLAKALEPERIGIPENSPTLTLRATQVGMILGTAAYMSPEQARGHDADKRSDIWVFGTVLYEMLTGRRAFEGETISDVLASVLKTEPDWARVPPQVQRLLRRCLEKDPRKRLQAIGDAKLLLEDAPPAPVASRTRILPWAIAAVTVVGLLIALAGWWRATRPVDHPLMRLSVDLGPDAVAGARSTAAISPDGTRLVFPIRAGDKQTLATRLLDQPRATPLAGTEDGVDPFFSPDGQWVGFFAGGKLKKISVTGVAAVTLCDAPNPRGGSWGEDGNIIAALTFSGGLSRIPAAGGVPQQLTERKQGETSHRWPQVLPGDNAVLFTVSTGSTSNLVDYEDASIDIVSLRTGQRKNLWRGGYFGRYLPANGSAGYLTYVHQGTLFGVPFNPSRLEVQGSPIPLLEDVAGNSIAAGGGQLDFSKTGTLVYLSGKESIRSWPVVWMDSSGKTQPLLAKPGYYLTPRLSPDGQRLALAVGTNTGFDIRVYDLMRDSMTRLSFAPGDNRWPVWTPDGKHIVFRTSSSSGAMLNWIRADGAGEAQKLLESKDDIRAHSFSPDGRRLAYYEQTAGTTDLWTLPLDLSDLEHPKPAKPEPFLRTPFNELIPVFSPDGRWLAYTSDESGRYEIYVRPFPGPGGKWQISTGGSQYAFWSRDGRELFYETPDNHIMVVEYTTKGDSFLPGKPRLWSEEQIYDTGTVNASLAPDGKRFAVFPRPESAEEGTGSLHVTLLLNFFDELRRRVPAGN
jgi:predicted Ser/Thr protein kinase/WD40 repeat protein